jgi:hypothetical protein
MKFKARNGGKAIAIHNHIRMLRAFTVTLPLCLILTVIYPPLFLSLLLPAGLLLLSFLVLLFERYDENVFLQGEKKDHTFRVTDGVIYKDGREIKLIRSIRIYRYKGFLYMETSHSMFVIRDTDYTEGSRSELIEWAKENGIPVRLGY